MGKYKLNITFTVKQLNKLAKTTSQNRNSLRLILDLR